MQIGDSDNSTTSDDNNNNIKLYYNINKKILLTTMSIEYNIPISCTSSFSVIKKFNQKYKGIILKLGKYELTKEYNYYFNLSCFGNYPLEKEYLIYGGKFEINDIIFNNKTHFHDYVHLNYINIL